MYGTLSVLDTLAASQQSVTEFGEDSAFAAIQTALDIHNAMVAEALDDLCEFTADNLRRYGSVANMEMEEVDEFGAVDTQKVSAGENVGFPLRKPQIAIGWTRTFMMTQPVAELAAQFTAAQEADRRRIMRDIKRALMTPTNNLTYRDRLVKNVVLPLRALVNADGGAVPSGPNGETFDGATHTHYLATAALTAANVSALIETVIEHGIAGQLRVYINRAQEAAIRAMPNFTGYVDARILPGSGSTVANGALDTTNLGNRAIGIFDVAEVWVKPWIPASYLFAFDRRGVMKPLAFRTRTGQPTGLGALTIAADHEHYPLRAQHLEREYGISAYTRTNGAVLYTGGGAYVAPVF